MASNFSSVLFDHLPYAEDQSPCQTALYQFYLTHASVAPAKAVFFASLECIVRTKMGLEPSTAVNWGGKLPAKLKHVQANGSVDWDAVLQFLETILPLLLPLIK